IEDAEGLAAGDRGAVEGAPAFDFAPRGGAMPPRAMAPGFPPPMGAPGPRMDAPGGPGGPKMDPKFGGGRPGMPRPADQGQGLDKDDLNKLRDVMKDQAAREFRDRGQQWEKGQKELVEKALKQRLPAMGGRGLRDPLGPLAEDAVIMAGEPIDGKPML